MGQVIALETVGARRLLAAATAITLLVLVSVAWAGPSWAHAVLVSSDPADGATLDEAPETVTFEFDETVSLDLGGLAVLDSSGTAVHDGDATSVGGVVSVGLPDDLDVGTYVASYRVLSADGHPISGAIVFGVGVAPDAASVTALTTANEEGWGLWAGLGRMMVFLGVLLAVGAAVFFAFLLDTTVPRRPFRWLVPAAAATALAGLPVMVVSTAARGSGQGWDVLGDGDLLRSALGQGLGAMAALSVLAVVLAVASATLGPRLLATGARQATAGASLVVASAAFAQWGHVRAADPRWLAVVGDVVHVAAAAVWLAGLVLLSWMLVARIGRAEAAAATLQRFSAWAAVLVAMVALGGGAMASTQLEAPSDLWGSDWGQVLAVKLALVALVLILAGLNRWRLLPSVLAHTGELDAGYVADGASDGSFDAGSDDGDGSSGDRDSAEVPVSAGGVAVGQAGTAGDDRRAEPTPQQRAWALMRASVGIEAALLVLVVLVTAVLVDVTPPGREATGAATVAGGEFSGEEMIGDTTLVVDVTPGRVGFNEVHLYYFGPDGSLADIAERVDIDFSLPAQDLGPITREAFRLTGGHYIHEGSELSVAGEWEITVVTRVSRFEEERSTFTVPIG
jgi:copper transport protein